MTTTTTTTTRLNRYVHFVDFDQPEEFEVLEKWSEGLDSRNFVLDFDNESARCARDLDRVAMAEVLHQQRRHPSVAATTTAAASPRSPYLEPPIEGVEYGGGARAAAPGNSGVGGAGNTNANPIGGLSPRTADYPDAEHTYGNSGNHHNHHNHHHHHTSSDGPLSLPPPHDRAHELGRRGTRWINIWAPEEQRAVVRRIGRHYGFSARLLASMCCAQAQPLRRTDSAEARAGEHRTVGDLVSEFMQPWRSVAQTARRNNKVQRPMAARMAAKAAAAKADEVEDAAAEGGSHGASESSSQGRASGASAPPRQQQGGGERGGSGRSRGKKEVRGGGVGATGTGLELDHYRLVNDVWHFSSIDWGAEYLCIGFNSLYRVDREINVDSYRPAGKRVWTWLVLCADGTVISIHENPFPGLRAPDLQQHQRRTLLAIRRNMRNIFKQLSRGFNDTNLQNVLEVVKLRSGMPTTRRRPSGGGNITRRHNSNGTTTGDDDDGGSDDSDSDSDSDDDSSAAGPAEGPRVFEEDAPSLLFYYLFDDWFTSYSLVARREHQYGVELDALRDRMFHRAELEHVSRLHHYGRQLAVLRRIYASYSTIIQRVLDGPQGQTQTHHELAVMRAGADLGGSISAAGIFGAGRGGAGGGRGSSLMAGSGVAGGAGGAWSPSIGGPMDASTSAATGLTGSSVMDGTRGGMTEVTASSELEPGRTTMGGSGGMGGARDMASTMPGTPIVMGDSTTVDRDGRQPRYGVTIALAASTRFRRLRDRINMYAIGEIADCMEEKNALMELNFNLITLKESSYIEGLTRITILLAKVTILFIPVSFITAYFTVNFTGADDLPVTYNVRQYWATFAVVLALTVGGLAAFGSLSGTQEGKPIYESFTKVFFKGWNGLWYGRHAGGGGGGGDSDDDEPNLDRDPSLIKLQALSRGEAGQATTTTMTRR